MSYKDTGLTLKGTGQTPHHWDHPTSAVPAAPTPPPAKQTLKIVEAEIYVCPRCLGYYGASGMPLLEDAGTGPKTEDRHIISKELSRFKEGVAGLRHSRAECPDCRLQGVYIERVRVVARASVPVDLAVIERAEQGE